MVGACTSSDSFLVRPEWVTISPSLWTESPFVFNLLFQLFRCFSLICFGFVFFSKVDHYVFFYFIVFLLVSVKLESWLQRKNLSSFNLGLIWFGYCGAFFQIQPIDLWFCGVSKLRWLL